ncbi:efflux RND transporter periplasmic adaptor subunit [Chelativorans sp. AA-79]|uniref:efflux RND transporter periplasmic adaptor subunit n=1 Tax=Chelativorans sp. AA-79 TaxID=3028735 RepID=UPI0023F6192A|nr:efflux RND transporter periplasmic adaptor subunit [Chelativorans sp. AA-79]WEX10634.1 efflux RND transporter periplasmic adaptor subunit [Chelativorans sp. AA-79]
MRTSTWIAIGLFAAVAAWLASGFVIGGGEEKEDEGAASAEPKPTLVEVRRSVAEPVPQYIYAQGVAQPFRAVDVISPTSGTLDEVLVQEGDEVETGQVLARVRLEARASQLRSAEARVERLQADLDALSELEGQGFATEARVRELRSQLEEARAALQSVRADIRDTSIEAPIPGIVSDVYVNGSETLTAGGAVARIVDNAPLLATLHISQRDVGRVDVGRVAVVSFATGDLAKGRVCFVAPAADPETRTFRVVIRVPNDERKIPSVVSNEVRFQTGEAQAHFISPSILALNEDGALGVKSVDENGTVRFHDVEVVRTGMDGIWIAGLPDQLRLITVGQGFVREGEDVRVTQAEGEGGTSQRAVQDVRLPTATVEAEHFNGAEDIPEPPPAEELCEGTASNTILTGSVPSTPAGSIGASDDSMRSTTGVSPGQGATGAEQPSGTGAIQQDTTPSSDITSPRISAPPTAQSPLQPSGAAQGQGGAAGGGATTGGAGGGGTGSSPAGGAQGNSP